MKTPTFLALLPLIALAGCPQKGGPSSGVTPGAEATAKPTSKASFRVLVVRHAQAYSNLPDTSGIPLEKLDTLTDKGQDQARAAAALIRSDTIAAIYSSPRGRTRETAQILKEAIGIESAIAVQDELAPIRDGVLPSGDPTPWSWRQEKWAAGADPRPEKGESLDDGARRALGFLEGVKEGALKGAVVIVTHSDIAAGIIGQAAGTPPWERYKKHKPPTGSVTELAYDGAKWSLVGRR